MEGVILGYQAQSNEGVIKGNDGNRYKFSKEDWKGEVLPQAGLAVDFELDEEGAAKHVYVSAAATADSTNNKSIFAVTALLLTLFLGFIGTLISRLTLAKQNVGDVWLPTLLHFLSAFLVLIPAIGWLATLGVNIYFSIMNYKLVNEGRELAPKYA